MKLMFSRRVFAFLFVAGILLVHTNVYADTNATLSGLVTDPQGRAVTDTTIILTNVNTGSAYQTKTNGEGIYRLNGLQPGIYRANVSKDGFKSIVKADIELHVQDQLSINFALQLGSVTETITVEAGAPLINTQDASVSTVVDQTYVKNMPLNGRSFQDLILLTPGVVTNSPQSGSLNGFNGEFSVNGQRTESNYYTVDGVSANTGISPGNPSAGNTGSVAAATALGTTQSIVSVDALQEFRVQSSTYSAEYGRNPGGQFSFVTRSGTNQWHGTAFDYLRNDFFDANNWFNNYFGIPEPPLRQNDFGATLGGPVKIPGLYNGRDKTFFFFSYEGLRVIQPQAATITLVPDSALRQATPAPLQQVLNGFPVQNGPEILDQTGNPIGLAEFIGAWSSPSSLDAYSVRFDHSINGKLRVFFRFSDTGSSATVRSFHAAFFAPSVAQASSYTARTYTFGATSELSNTLSNEFRINYTSNSSRLESHIDNFGGAQPVDLVQLQQFSPSPSSFFITPRLIFSGHDTALNQESFRGVQRQWNITDSLSVTIGRNQLKFGVDYRRLTPIQQNGSPQLDYFFFGQNEVKTNGPDLALALNFADIFPLVTNFSALAQDEWRVTQRLNLSMGLRWEVNPATDVTQGPLPLTVQGANNLSTMTLAPLGTPLWKTTWYNFAPRLGAAYVLRNASGHETVLRGGGGLFYDTGQQTGTNGFNGPNYVAVNVLGSFSMPPISFPLSPAQALPPISQNPAPPFIVYAYPPHLQLPYTIQWNTSIEQALGSSQVLSISYVGSHAGRLLQQSEIQPGTVNPNFIAVHFYRNGSTADYNALQVQFQRRMSHGLTALAAYTFGHSIDYGSTGLTFPYTRGNSDFDVRHNFTSAFSYDLPNAFQNRFARAILHHWGVDDRLTARTSFPVTLDGAQVVDPATGQTTNGGLNLVPGQPVYLYGSNCASVLQALGNLSPGQGCPGGRAINPNAFCDPSAGPCLGGQAPRNFVRGLSAWQMDLAVRREFPIYENLKLQFRAEGFNVFNHPNFGTVDPNYCFPGCTFGQATSTLNSSLGILSPLYQTGGPRSMQFALKLVF